MIQREQLFKTAVDSIILSSPKKILSSRYADSTESLPCTAFFVPSVPNSALID
jgi:hypothetical protein